MINKITGIVINKLLFHEYDEVITICTEENIKLSFYALGSRKVTSKNQYSLQLGATSEFELFLTKTAGRLSKLKTGHLITSRFALAQNYDDYLLTILLIEVSEQVLTEANLKFSLFNLLNQTLDYMILWTDNLWLCCYYLFYCLKGFGQDWWLGACVRCGSTERIKTISFAQEGLVCVNCYSQVQDPVFTMEFVKAFVRWNSSDFNMSELNCSITPDMLLFFKLLCEYYLTRVGIFSYSIYEMQRNSLYFK